MMLTVFATLWFGLDAIEFALLARRRYGTRGFDEDIMVELSTAEFGAMPQLLRSMWSGSSY